MPEFSPLPPTTWGERQIAWGARTWVMGILNITPDSFSQDGVALERMTRAQVVSAALEQAQRMVAHGAVMIDVGGESTRPASVDLPPLPPEIERERVVPVIEALTAALPPHIIISIDTYKAAVAEAALDAGAHIVNDIWGLRADPDMAPLLAEREVPVVVMSNLRGQVRREPLADVMRQLSGSLDLALRAGIAWNRIILDPGFGFGLHGEENLRVMARLSELRALERPILVGTSRKSYIGQALGGAPVGERVEGTAATVTLCIAQGADIVRVHDVAQMARVVQMTDAVVRGWRGFEQPIAQPATDTSSGGDR
ncbi:MAG TPA: dihydropteroate synthase [Ktedonobacterales bacterium]|jgi:dihydropteroate synthase|nr:dihydropteroate synthase [Ktedonobacterales bacterium]